MCASWRCSPIFSVLPVPFRVSGISGHGNLENVALCCVYVALSSAHFWAAGGRRQSRNLESRKLKSEKRSAALCSLWTFGPWTLNSLSAAIRNHLQLSRAISSYLELSRVSFFLGPADFVW